VKVLLVSPFHPELMKGGSQQICYELFEGLQELPDVEPVLLAAVDESFGALFKSGARITGFDRRENEFLYLSRGYDFVWHKAGVPELVEAYIEFLELVRPDVVHFHHFLLFGLDLLTVTRRTLPNARIIFTFHEFIAICDADGHLVRRNDGSLCSRASSVRCHQCFPDRTPEHFFMREMWVKRHLAAVDVFTVPSAFMIEHFVRWGLEPSKITHVTNGQRDYSHGRPVVDERVRRNRFGFFGQLIDIKGVQLLLRAVRQLRTEGFTDLVVEINGGNLHYATEACRTEIEGFLEEEEKLPFDQRIVVLNGPYQVDQLRQRMARVDWCIVPSIWLEAFALVISEAWMFRKPVICSNAGAMAERVSHEVDGLHFEMGNENGLAQALRQAATEPGLWDRLAVNIPQPPRRDDMVKGFRTLYDAEQPAAMAEITSPLRSGGAASRGRHVPALD
jgi:glycosyltransferase involved in cell wall biosynthesis